MFFYRTFQNIHWMWPIHAYKESFENEKEKKISMEADGSQNYIEGDRTFDFAVCGGVQVEVLCIVDDLSAMLTLSKIQPRIF